MAAGRSRAAYDTSAGDRGGLLSLDGVCYVYSRVNEEESLTRRLVFNDHEPEEDSERLEVRRIERGDIRVTIETSLSAEAQMLALARDLHHEIELWFALDQRWGS